MSNPPLENPPLGPEELIARLSHRPKLLDAMITVPDLPNLPDSAPAGGIGENRASSLGALDCLPLEIIWAVLDQLDALSIAHLAAVSSQGHAIIQSQHTYWTLVALARPALIALRKTGLIGLHSVDELHAVLRSVLRSPQCTICQGFGVYPFLPTYERCCWECLSSDPSLRVILPRDAKRFFGLSERHLRQLPTVHVIPGHYGPSGDPAPDSCQLVSAHAARALGLQVHGSAEKMARVMERRCKTPSIRAIGHYFQGSRPEINHDPIEFSLTRQGNAPHDDFFGMASLPFPPLSPSGSIEHGLWCRGCNFLFTRFSSRRLALERIPDMRHQFERTYQTMHFYQRLAHSKEGFLEHLNSCFIARELI